MQKVIYEGKSKIFYNEGDEIYSVHDNIPRIIQLIRLDDMRIVCTDGTVLPLTTDVRATQKTLDMAKIIDRREKVSKPSYSKNIMYFAKTNENAVLPTKRDEDSCYDLYACFDDEYIEIEPHTVKMIGTGIATAFDNKYKAIVYERGSSGSIGMAVRCGVIDSGYRSEWFVAINNTTAKTIIITKKTDKVAIYADRIAYPYTKAIAQFALELVPVVESKEISWDELKEIESERGLGKLGSSQK